MDGMIGRHLPARIPDGTTSRMPGGDLHCTKFKQAIRTNTGNCRYCGSVVH
jgi:hypothetical protein